ncbi:MAG: GNAT family N-acetyltransferase [Chitinophagales bacterium]|nr:GNAT family N-acetyltransferase [Chitinophagales bacterium]
MNVRQLTETEEHKWNAFVDVSTQGSLFSKTWYLKSIGLSYRIYVVERNNEICAGIILGNRKSAYTTGPMQKYTGVLFGNFEGNAYTVTSSQRSATKLLLEAVKEFKTFDYFFHPAFLDWMLFHQAGYKEMTYYTYRISLEGLSDEDVLRLCSPRLRNKIRNALAESEQKIVTDINPELFYEVNSKTFERQNRKPPVAKERFLSIYEALKAHNAVKLYGVTEGKDKIGAVLGIAYDKTCAYLLFSGFDPEQSGSNNTELLIYKAICDARGRVKIFDFEGSMLPGVESFYRQFGGTLTPYFRIYCPTLLKELKLLIKR